MKVYIYSEYTTLVKKVHIENDKWCFSDSKTVFNPRLLNRSDKIFFYSLEKLSKNKINKLSNYQKQKLKSKIDEEFFQEWMFMYMKSVRWPIRQ